MRLHDPYPDGKSGPWLREPHHKRTSSIGTQTLDFDPRCAACVKGREELEAREARYWLSARAVW